jgi:hypothetical protein
MTMLREPQRYAQVIREFVNSAERGQPVLLTGFRREGAKLCGSVVI